MKTKKLTAVLMAGVLAAVAAGCGGSAGTGGADGSSDNTVTIWATGSDNVRQIYEALVEDFNTNSDYAGTYTAELQFMLS